MAAPLRIGSTDRVFVLTGAGIRAESGIRTFRDPDGLCGPTATGGGRWESRAVTIGCKRPAGWHPAPNSNPMPAAIGPPNHGM